jgi:hypothetical protein
MGRRRLIDRPAVPELYEGQANEFGQLGLLDVWYQKMLTE